MAVINEILESIGKGCLGRDYFFNADEFDIDDILPGLALSHREEEEGSPLTWDSGATKLVIIPNEENYVIKIPFEGSDECSCDCSAVCECCDCSVCMYSNRWDCSQIQSASRSSYSGAPTANGWDYCAAELLNYEAAEDEDLADCFAKVELICTIHSHPIYKQEKAELYSDHNHKYEEGDERTSSTREYCNRNNIHIFNLIWQSDFIDYFGFEKFNAFMDFINNSSINDLHCGNVGYIGDRPVLIDYSGFYS